MRLIAVRLQQNGDGIVNFLDFAQFAEKRPCDKKGGCQKTDISPKIQKFDNTLDIGFQVLYTSGCKFFTGKVQAEEKTMERLFVFSLLSILISAIAASKVETSIVSEYSLYQPFEYDRVVIVPHRLEQHSQVDIHTKNTTDQTWGKDWYMET